MADPIVANSGGATTPVAGTSGSDGVVIDKKKTNEQYIQEAEAKYIVPALVREKFPDLIKLIYETESMNEEERQYWLQIMPVMSEEQIVKFRDILVNEKQQLAKLDQEYNQEMKKVNKSPAPEMDEAKRKEDIAKIKAAEKTDEEKEKSDEEALMSQLKGL